MIHLLLSDTTASWHPQSRAVSITHRSTTMLIHVDELSTVAFSNFTSQPFDALVKNRFRPFKTLTNRSIKTFCLVTATVNLDSLEFVKLSVNRKTWGGLHEKQEAPELHRWGCEHSEPSEELTVSDKTRAPASTLMTLSLLLFNYLGNWAFAKAEPPNTHCPVKA